MKDTDEFDSFKDSFIQDEAGYHRILESFKNEFLFYSHDINNVYTYVSPSVENMLGYTQKEFMSSFQSIWTDNPINKEAGEKAKLSLQGIRQLPYELEVYHKDGSIRWILIYETPIRNSDGKTVRVEVISRDISEKKKVEAKLEQYREDLEKQVEQRTRELQNSHKQLLDIIEFLPDATYVVDIYKNIIAWNRALEELSGIKKKEAIGKQFHQFIGSIYPGDKPFLIDLLGLDPVSVKLEDKEIRMNNGILSVDRYLPELKGGEAAYVSITTGSILDHDLNLIGAVEIIRDITQLKDSERKIRENEQRLSAVMNRLPGMAYRIIKEKQWKLEFVSEGCRYLTGHDSSYFIDQGISKFFGLIHEEDIERVEKEFQAAIDTKRNFQAEYRIITSTGEIKWVFNRAEGATFDYEGTIRIEGFITDFTAYKDKEQQLKNENLLLRSTMRDRYKFGNIIGNSKVMQDVYELILKAATTNDSVFIHGESGTGKELVSLAIHNASNRRDKKCVIVNCGAIPENLIESEFFGSVKGAFTGANTDKKGYLETANGGTLFLDEIGEISLNMQVKLLRAIDGGGFSPIGSQKVIKPDLRIIAASNKNPINLMKKGNMRSDFFFRIHVIPINLPPLRERGDDIFLLADNFLKTYSKTDSIATMSPRNLKILKDYYWPGNVRELQNIMRRYITMRNLDFLTGDNTPAPREAKIVSMSEEEILSNTLSLSEAVGKFEKKYIVETLKANRWQKGKTASILNVSRKTLFRKMKTYEIT
ncbi:sigma 54-interacting transcriptional regulator [bacterium]|nr:sigma 54-interacting transcriptional regulator [bacterium]